MGCLRPCDSSDTCEPGEEGEAARKGPRWQCNWANDQSPEEFLSHKKRP